MLKFFVRKLNGRYLIYTVLCNPGQGIKHQRHVHHLCTLEIFVVGYAAVVVLLTATVRMNAI